MGRGIHWRAWDKMTTPKANGGMGIRDIEGFNLALLEKQIWRISNNLDSLMVKVFKGKYFPKCSVLEAPLGNIPSFAWRSIHAGQDLMKMGMRKEFGDGQDISLLTDPWLPVNPQRPPRLKKWYQKESINMERFKNSQSDQWKIRELKKAFQPEDVPLILQIKPGMSKSHKYYSWIHNNNGDFTVKSVYWIWKQQQESLKEDGLGRQQPSLSPLYKAI